MAKSRFQKKKGVRPVNTIRPSPLRTAKSIAASVLLVFLTALAVGLAVLIVEFVRVSRDLPSVQTISWLASKKSASSPEDTRIYYADTDEDGNPKLLAVLSSAYRIPVELGQISKHLIDATIAVEDARFYAHRGVDFVGIARALLRNVTGGNLTAQGGSTITQQLARNIEDLRVGRKKRLDRKLREAILAARIEQLCPKEEILKHYLNTIYYGNGAYGAEAAARVYFHKSAKHLTLAEAAYLAGLPQRPVAYSHDRKAARARQLVVLDRMVETEKITRSQRDAAAMQPLEVHRTVVKRRRVFGAPYFVDYVVRWLESSRDLERDRKGLDVYTTLDSRMQALAEDVLSRGIRRSGYANQGCLVCIENKTGYIRAMVGGMDYKRDQFNIVTSGVRQPGSAFKPVVYTAAIDTGVCDLHSRFRDDPDFPWRGRDRWIPKNYGGRYSYASVTVRDAIRRSLNTVAVKVAVRTGISVVIEYAKKMGITTELAPYPPLALGASAVHPIDLCVVYSVFANGGRRLEPLPVTKVLERDGTSHEYEPEFSETGIQPGTIEQMNEALRAVVTSGTATAASSVPEARGKTGTTSDNRDAWFAGYTPELTTVIWVAREQRTGRQVKYLEMPGATGGRLCAPIWRDFMLRAVELQHEATARDARAAERKASPSEPSPEEASEKPILDEPAPTSPEPGTEVPSAEPTPPAPAPDTGPASADVQPTSVPAREEPPPTRPDPGAEVVRVRTCAETHQLATIYCPVTIERSMPRRDVPRLCRLHRPPPGEGR